MHSSCWSTTNQDVLLHLFFEGTRPVLDRHLCLHYTRHLFSTPDDLPSNSPAQLYSHEQYQGDLFKPTGIQTRWRGCTCFWSIASNGTPADWSASSTSFLNGKLSQRSEPALVMSQLSLARSLSVQSLSISSQARSKRSLTGLPTGLGRPGSRRIVITTKYNRGKCGSSPHARPSFTLTSAAIKGTIESRLPSPRWLRLPVHHHPLLPSPQSDLLTVPFSTCSTTLPDE